MVQLTSLTGISCGAKLRAALLAAAVVSLWLAASALAADTTIDTGPPDPTNDDTPTFSFSSPDDPLATFECRVDGAPFGGCSDPPDSHTTPPLDDGSYTFEVRAVDLLLMPDPTPASRSFRVDTVAPDTTIDTGPPDPTNDDTPTFSFSSPDDPLATFECRIDSDPFEPCSGSGYTTAPLSDGPHTFEVRATDAAGNTDAPASRTWTIDTTPPNTTIDSGPTGTTPDETPTFGFSSNELGSSFECRIDSGSFGACSGPGRTHTTGELADGGHTFSVRATDGVGNTDPNFPSQAFTVDTSLPPDTTGPDTRITKRPKPKIRTKRRKAKIKVSFRSEAGATHRCRLDRGKYRPCTSPFSVKAKSRGGKGKKHTISIRSADEAGNIGKPVTVRFRVKRTQRLLKAPVARRAVVKALKRHGFARRVVRSTRIGCQRRSRNAFGCRFSARFPGYRMRGSGRVKLGLGLSYRFRVRAQGVRFVLTDGNEGRRSESR